MLFYLIIIIVIILAFSLVLLRQHALVRQLRTLAKEADENRLQAEAEQLRNQQLKQEMTNNIAHELKTPVSSIRGYLEILLGDKPVEEEKRRFFLDRCYNQTLRLSDLINDVSLINKLEESSALLPKETIDVSAIADEAIRELDTRAAARCITVHNLLASPMSIQGNHNLIYAIFRNLVENSLTYAGDNIMVQIECYKETDEIIYLHFFDTGCGVENQYLDKIFDRFLRIDGGRSRKNGGTGLGLSIVKHAVIFHGGDIYAKNRDEGGLEFYFSLKKQ